MTAPAASSAPTAAPGTPPPGRVRTTVDLVLGVLVVVGGVLVLAEVAAAGVLSVRFLGWAGIGTGVVLVLAALRPGSGDRYGWALVGGSLLLLLGLSFVRHPTFGLLSLTLVAGPVLILDGGSRAWSSRLARGRERLVLLGGGLLSLVLGAVVFFGWPASSTWFIGTVLGVDIVLAGVAMVTAGWTRRATVQAGVPSR